MAKKKKRRRAAGSSSLILIILIVVMIVTNPTKDDFYSWLENRSLETSETAVGGAIKNMLVTPVVKSVTVRKDYLVVSTYHIELDGNEDIYLGLFKQFIQIKD